MVPSVALDPVRTSSGPQPVPAGAPSAPPLVRSAALQSGDRLALSTAPAEDAQLAEHVPGELIVRFRGDLSAQSVDTATRILGLKVIKKFVKPDNMQTTALDNLYHVRITSRMSVTQAMAYLSRQPQVVYAEPNYIAHATDDAPAVGEERAVRMGTATQPGFPASTTDDAPAVGEERAVRMGTATQPGSPASTTDDLPAATTTPNDLDSRLWGLRNNGQDGGKAGADIHAAEAWAITTGSKTASPLIAVIDTGIDYRHPEIAPNMSPNAGEIPGNGADDDHNGFVDDYFGYNFVNKTGDPMDDNEHGTHVSGTIAAQGNNGQGVTGVMWNGRLMAAKFLNGGGSGTYADAISAVLYTAQRGARVTSNSWGGGGFSQALRDAMAASPALHVVAAGNDGHNNDQTPTYPAAFGLPNEVVVAATDRNDHLASFSNWGPQGVDVAAPGVDIFSTAPNNAYATLSGTSMATPHVSGVVGLILTRFPNLTNEQVKARLINSADPLPELQGKIVSGGRVNAAAALAQDSAPPANVTDLHGLGATESAVVLGWTATGDDGSSGQARRYDLRYATRPITSQADFDAATRVTVAAPKPAGQAEQARITGLQPSDQGTRYYFALKAQDKVGNATALATASAATLPARSIFRDDMEQNSDNWQPEAPWGKLATDRGTSFKSNPTGSYGSNANTSLVSKPLDLSGLHSATLSAALKWDLETNYDNGYVEISKDGGHTWSQLDKFTGNSNGWSQKTFDLSAYAGGPVQLRFRLTSDGSVERDGIYVDDVSIVSGG